jgi:hypothetical protein
MANSINSSTINEKQPGRAPPADLGESAGNTAADVPPFKWSHLWEQPIMYVYSSLTPNHLPRTLTKHISNPVNLKSYTLPIFNLNNPYTRSFHLSWRELSFVCEQRVVLTSPSNTLMPRVLHSRLFCSVSVVVCVPTAHSRSDQERPQTDSRPNCKFQHCCIDGHPLRASVVRSSRRSVWPQKSDGRASRTWRHPLWFGWDGSRCEVSLRIEIFHWYPRWDLRSLPGLDVVLL